MNLLDIPGWITTNYPRSQNMRQLAERLAGTIGAITPFVEANFCSNQIKSEEVLDPRIHAKSLWEGLWHLHVLWCMHAHELELRNPESVGSNDDGIVIYNGEMIGIEATFTSWGTPGGVLASTYRNMTTGQGNWADVDTDTAIVDQVGLALMGKESKLAKRQPEIPRIVALNEVFVTAGFPGFEAEIRNRRSRIVQDFQTRNPVGITGITYDYVGYGDLFQDPRLTLVGLGTDVNKYRGLATVLE